MQPLNIGEEGLGLSKTRGINLKLVIAILVISIIAGTGTGYLMASSGSGGNVIPLVQSMQLKIPELLEILQKEKLQLSLHQNQAQIALKELTF